MDVGEWFNKGDYSDLTIKLSNGSEVKVHKIIVCQQNEYFRKLCGPNSHFAESKQNTIELKDDHPDALTGVLRSIYKLPAVPSPSLASSWRFWLSLRATADKYLEPILSEDADRLFREYASEEPSGDKVFGIIEAINHEFQHDESLLEFAGTLRKNNLGLLLKNERFRSQLDSGGKEMLWQVLDDLVFAADLKKKCHHLCIHHKDVVFQDVGMDGPVVAHCEVCLQTNNYWDVQHMDRSPGSILWTLD